MNFINALPSHLQERVRILRESDRSDGEFVLYWTQTAMRVDENPALDVARHCAAQLDLPLLVYQGLSARQDYASDRHHTFILQGAADLQSAYHTLGIAYACVLEQTGDELKRLLQRAAVVVVEDMPTDPSRFFRRAAMRHTAGSMWAVDTACVVPMQLVGQAYERAFEYRDATRKLYKERLLREWPSDVPAVRPVDAAALDLQAIDFTRASIEELVAGCEIDHLVAPVLDTLGGSRAGYVRWEAFKAKKLRRYADDRNDALKDASSRMSAYLHYGMVSPMRIAREAATLEPLSAKAQNSQSDRKAKPGPGAEKYLEELLIWRELAYGFCHYRPDHDRMTALPSWARETLDKHRHDRRPQQYTWEELSRGATLDAFWNAAQRSLLVHGELHNNVRMTWGKALLGWCDDPRQVLKHLIDLNHRYALDGRDPASFGGLLWCLGQFDRPFSPEQPIYGTIRTRPTWEHAKRLNVKAYAQHTGRPRREKRLRVAVIGAGLSGSMAARTLEDQGEEVELFEKSERPSGRMSTRRTEIAEFDHGAQYFTCRDRTFQKYVDSWIDAGAVAQWQAPIAVFKDGQLQSYSSGRRYVAVPHMNELGKRLTRLMKVHYGVHIEVVERQTDGWKLVDKDQRVYGPYDRIICALPAPQTAALVRGEAEFVEQLQSQRFHPCWAVMASLPGSLPVDFGGAFINSGAIGWMARNQTKPGRGGASDSSSMRAAESIVLHATPEWSLANLERDAAWVAEQLTTELTSAIGLARPIEPTQVLAHRWRYARPVTEQALRYRCLFNANRTLVACGDWASGSRVEGAFLSGAAAAGIIAQSGLSDK